VRSLRGRLSLGVGVVIAAVLGASGVLISNYAERIARDGVDDRLRRTAELTRATAVDAVENALPDTDKRLDGVLRATGSSLRLLIGDAVVLEGGTPLLRGATPPEGLRTVERDARRIRVLVVPLRGIGLGRLAKLEVATSLADVERRQAELDSRLVQLGIAALAVIALGTFLAAAGVLRPLRRLRKAAGRIAAEEDLSVRVAENDGPAEVRGMAASFNAMLERLSSSAQARERALEATRRFAFDAGHELRTPLTTVQATLSALHRHPDVDPEQRTAMLADALAEQRRLVTLLDGLQALARGDASDTPHEPVDLADVVGPAVADTRTRHPEASIEVKVPDGPVMVSGWEPGLRSLVGNLVGNAAHHGGGRVLVTVTGGERPALWVDDDGPGIAPADRELVFEPFRRLQEAADRPGTGLGLALVAQQVRTHGATVSVHDSPLGGARFAVAFPPFVREL
jgi:signal transduction histidine kinase